MSYIDPRGKVLTAENLTRLVHWDDGQTPGPRTIEWDLSNACTLGCEFADGSQCHFAYTHVKGPWTGMPRTFPVNQDKGGAFADTALVLRALRQVKEAGVESIVWTGGGEPTTHPDWQRIVTEAQQVGVQQGMYTHGGLLSPEKGALLAQIAEWVVVSLDFADAESYARYKHVPQHRFQAVCDGVLWLTGHKAVVGVSYLLHGQNWMKARDMVKLSRDLGAHYTTFRPSINTSPAEPNVLMGDRRWVTDALPLLLELEREADIEINPRRFLEYRDWTTHGYSCCEGIKLNATITPDGRVWVCPNRREYANSCLGDLRTESFSELWARHPGQWTDFRECRAMCRLHAVNQAIASIRRPRVHEAFI